MHKATWIKDERFWCSHCDDKLVDSDDPRTGDFFGQFGHPWDPYKRQAISTDFPQVIFALCIDCQDPRR